MRVQSVQTKLLLIFLPLIFIVLGVLSGVSYYVAQKALVSSIDQTALAIGSEYSSRLQKDMEELVGNLEGIAAIDFVREGTDQERIVTVMADMKQRVGIFGTVAYIAPNGSAITSDRKLETYAERDYFKQALATKKMVATAPMMSKSLKKLVVILAVPVLNNGQVTGVLMGNVPLDRVGEMLKNVKYLDTGYGVVVDESGLIIADPAKPEVNGKINLIENKLDADLDLPQKSLDSSAVELFTKAGQSASQMKGEYKFLDNVTRTAVCTPINLPGNRHWIMAVSAPQEEFTKDVAALGKAVLGISLICLLLAGIAIRIIAKKFTSPIATMRDECVLLAGGDLRDRNLRVDSEDEIGQLCGGFLDMRGKLRKLITKIYSQAEQLAAASEELTASAEQSSQTSQHVAESTISLAEAASEQKKSADESFDVVQDMSNGIKKIAGHAQSLSENSSQAAAKAEDGNQAIEKAVTQMEHIEGTVNSSAEVVSKLGEQSKEIGQIVDVISGIAEQTNLLALNAAIEAARAGEQGRGFAVVADEVRKLAEQSQKAAQQIAELIQSIQGDTTRAVTSMSSGVQEVHTGTEVVHAAGASFREIIKVVDRVSDGVNEISAAIQELANGSAAIVGSVQKIGTLSAKSADNTQNVSASTEEQLASMEEISSASQSLAKLAQELQDELATFKI